MSTRLLAFNVALKYRDSVPTPELLERDYGMSRATAYRWCADLLTARQVVGLPTDKTLWHPKGMACSDRALRS